MTCGRGQQGGNWWWEQGWIGQGREKGEDKDTIIEQQYKPDFW